MLTEREFEAFRRLREGVEREIRRLESEHCGFPNWIAARWPRSASNRREKPDAGAISRAARRWSLAAWSNSAWRAFQTSPSKIAGRFENY
jgi:hypothetical protein